MGCINSTPSDRVDRNRDQGNTSGASSSRHPREATGSRGNEALGGLSARENIQNNKAFQELKEMAGNITLREWLDDFIKVDYNKITNLRQKTQLLSVLVSRVNFIHDKAESLGVSSAGWKMVENLIERERKIMNNKDYIKLKLELYAKIPHMPLACHDELFMCAIEMAEHYPEMLGQLGQVGSMLNDGRYTPKMHDTLMQFICRHQDDGIRLHSLGQLLPIMQASIRGINVMGENERNNLKYLNAAIVRSGGMMNVYPADKKNVKNALELLKILYL